MPSATKNELAVAIKHLAAERNLPRDVVREALEAALVSAYKKTPEAAAQHITVDIETADGKPRVYAEKEIVPDVKDDRVQISLEDAQQVDPLAYMGGSVKIDVTPDDFGRIAAQTAKQVILQRIREAERDQVFSQYSQAENEIIQATVQSTDGPDVTLALDKAEARLPRKEQIPKEHYTRGQRLKVYVIEVKKTGKGPEIIVSRTHRNMLRRLLEHEVPEIYNGSVEIKAIAREAGSRSKVAVSARQEGIDPVGACVGMRGVRIQALVNELGGEKIDVVEWSQDPALFIAKALSPAIVLSVNVEEGPDGRTAKVIVPDKQLSLAIGKEGQNARLAAKLTGWRIDIKSESEARAELERIKAEEVKRSEHEAKLQAARDLLAEAERLAAEERAAEAGEVEPIAAEVEPVAAEIEVEAPTVEIAPEAPAEIEAPKVEVAPPAPAPVVPSPAPVAPPAPQPAPAARAETIFDFKMPEIPIDEAEEEEEVGQAKGKKGKKKTKGPTVLVRDERTGRLVKPAKRKPGRERPAWEDESFAEEEGGEDLDIDYYAKTDDDDYEYDPDA
ncbi:MAG: transcription termination factor NusA [Anaerolineae bacterium]